MLFEALTCVNFGRGGAGAAELDGGITTDTNREALCYLHVSEFVNSPGAVIRLEVAGETFTFSETDFPAAIKNLREALGRSQEGMARLLGCSVPGYQKWELGKAIPSGEWLLRMLQLCPDEATRNTFRIRAERRGSDRRRPPPLDPSRDLPLSGERRQTYREAAHDAIEILVRCGDLGIEPADARLRDFAENLYQAGEYYRKILGPKE